MRRKPKRAHLHVIVEFFLEIEHVIAFIRAFRIIESACQVQMAVAFRIYVSSLLGVNVAHWERMALGEDDSFIDGTGRG